MDTYAQPKTYEKPYKGASNVITDLMGGQVDLGFETTSVTFGHVHEGKVRALGVATQASEMSFSVSCARHRLEYAGRRPLGRAPVRLVREIAG